MPTPPSTLRTIAFVDGQNLYFAAKEAFRHEVPNYDVQALSHRVCQDKGWALNQVRFYTGMPDIKISPGLHHFWTAKLRGMKRRGVTVYSRPLRYRTRTIDLPNGQSHQYHFGEEKGVDVRMAVDIIRLAMQNAYDVALVFSQDQDLSEAAGEIRRISQEQGRWIKVASAFPSGGNYSNHRGINRTDWIRIEKSTYDACLDRNNYWPRKR